MTLQEQIRAKREEAGRLLEAADALRQKHAGNDWPADADEQFDKLLADQTAAVEAAEALTARANAERELDERLAAQRTPARPAPAAGPSVEQHAEKRATAHREAFTRYLTAPTQGAAETGAVEVLNAAGFDAREVNALLGTNDNLGGFLVSDEFSNEVLKDLAGMATMRSISRTMTTGGPALTFPTVASATTDADLYTSGYTGSWRSEGYIQDGTVPTTQDQPTFGQARIPVHVWQPDAIEVTQELLADSGANLDALLASVIAETRALDEDAAFTNGTGINRPKGITTETFAGVQTANANSALTYDEVVDTFTSLYAQYRGNATWVMSSDAYAEILKIADSNGQPMVAMVSGSPFTTLMGRPMRFNEFMPNMGAAATNAIVFGDFNYYGIVDRAGLRVQRLTEKFAPNVGLLAHARVGGQVLRTAAFTAITLP